MHADALLAECDPPTLSARPQLVAAREALAADAFANAYAVFLRDFDEGISKGDDIYGRMVDWRDKTCLPALEEKNKYEEANRAYKATECGATTAPPEVVERCRPRQAELVAWHDRVEPRRLAALATLNALQEESNALDPLLRRAIGNAQNLLNPDNTEQAFRLYIFWAVELDKGTPSRDRNSCLTFADVASALGRRVKNQAIFIDLLVRNVVERRLDVNLFTGSPPLTPVTRWGQEFGSRTQAFNAKGFKRQFYDNVSENQVRHVAGYMRSGCAFNGTAGQLVSWFSDKRIGEMADYRLSRS